MGLECERSGTVESDEGKGLVWVGTRTMFFFCTGILPT